MTKRADEITAFAKQAAEENRQQAIRRAEELAVMLIPDHRGETSLTLEVAAAILTKYGQEVREACAKQADENCGHDCDGTAKAIREMPLP